MTVYLHEEDLPEGEMVQLEDVDNEVEDTEDGGAIIREKNDTDHADKLAHFATIPNSAKNKSSTHSTCKQRARSRISST